jgi:hypothetical protein
MCVQLSGLLLHLIQHHSCIRCGTCQRSAFGKSAIRDQTPHMEAASTYRFNVADTIMSAFSLPIQPERVLTKISTLFCAYPNHSILDQSLLVTSHLPAPRNTMLIASIQYPSARTNSLESLIVPHRLYAIIYECTILAKRNDFIVTEFVRLPRPEVRSLQHFINCRRGDGSQQEVPREDHDRVGGEKRKEVGAGFAERSPCAVFEGADGCCDGWVGERWSCHLVDGCDCSSRCIVAI